MERKRERERERETGEERPVTNCLKRAESSFGGKAQREENRGTICRPFAQCFSLHLSVSASHPYEYV